MITFLSFIFVLSLLVFVHEFGHYLIAKLSGIGVERFSIGLPPRLVGVRIGETEYCISMIPFGGYVKLIGQDDFAQEEEKGDMGPRDYRGKSVPVKIAVLFAGSLMNILTAVLIFSILFRIHGVPESSNRIGYVTPGTYAEEIGLKSGDEILALNGKEIDMLEQAHLSLYTEDSISLTVRNLSGERTVKTTRKLNENEDFGIVPYLDARVDRTVPESPAEQAGFSPGDVITAIENEFIDGGWWHMTEIIRANPDRKLMFTIERDGSEMRIPVMVEHVEEEMPDGTKKTIGRIGIYPRFSTLKMSGIESLRLALGKTKFIAVYTLDIFGKLVTGRLSSKLLGGPVLIAQMAGESAKSGFANLLFFTALLSINLGILNLLPFPVLDGGHILLLLIEAVTRRKVSTRIRMAVQQAGSIILILFMIYITFNDLMRIETIARIFGGD